MSIKKVIDVVVIEDVEKVVDVGESLSHCSESLVVTLKLKT
jgi:hypothetical protein